MILEVIKTINKLNASCICDLFMKNKVVCYENLKINIKMNNNHIRASNISIFGIQVTEPAC